jgi:hypothetical protein
MLLHWLRIGAIVTRAQVDQGRRQALPRIVSLLSALTSQEEPLAHALTIP